MAFWPHHAAGALVATTRPATAGGLWLRVMGFTQLALGGAFFLLQAWRQAGAWLQQWPEQLPRSHRPAVPRGAAARGRAPGRLLPHREAA